MIPAAKPPVEDGQRLARDARKRFVKEFAGRIEEEAEKIRGEVARARDIPEERIGFMSVYSDRDKPVKEDSPLIKAVERREREKAEGVFSGLGRHEISFGKSGDSMLVDVGRIRGMGDGKTFTVASLDELRKREEEMIVRQPALPKESILKTKPAGKEVDVK